MTIERAPSKALGDRGTGRSETTTSGGHGQGLHGALRQTDGYDAQVQLLRPEGAVVQKMDDEDHGHESKEEGSSEKAPSVPRAEVVFSALHPSQVVQQSSEAVVAAVAKLLAEYVNAVHYNSLEDGVAFVEHLRAKRAEEPSTTAQEAFEDHAPNSIAPLHKARGAQCVGQGIDIAQRVSEQTGLPAYPVAAQFATRAKDRIHTHGAAMIAFANPLDQADTGYVLLDPGFNVSTPVVVTAALPAPVRSFVYSLQSAEGNDEVVSHAQKDHAKIVEFPANKVPDNPEAISKMALLTYQAFTVVNRAGKARRYMSLDLAKDNFKLVFASAESKKVTTVEIDTSDLESAKHLIAEAINADVAEMFGYPDPETLLDSVFKVLDSKRDILSLQRSKIRD